LRNASMRALILVVTIIFFTSLKKYFISLSDINQDKYIDKSN